jgi:predicted DNA-binding protein (UPF0251 family)
MSDKDILEKAISKAIEGYETTQVGRVWNKKTGREVFGSVNTNGYRCFKIWLPELKISKRIYHHRFVAQQHGSNPENLPHVNHKDGNKLNNATWNLEWVTHKQNMIHAWNNGLLPKPPHVPGEKAGNHKLSWEQVEKIRSRHLQGHSNVDIAKRFGMHQSTIARAVKGQTWKQMVIAEDSIKYLGENI